MRISPFSFFGHVRDAPNPLEPPKLAVFKDPLHLRCSDLFALSQLKDKIDLGAFPISYSHKFLGKHSLRQVYADFVLPLVTEQNCSKRSKEFSIRDSHMVTHCSTNRTIQCLFTAERTGCEIFIVLWPNTLSKLLINSWTTIGGHCG